MKIGEAVNLLGIMVEDGHGDKELIINIDGLDQYRRIFHIGFNNLFQIGLIQSEPLDIGKTMSDLWDEGIIAKP